MYSLKSVNKCYRNVEALSNLSCEIPIDQFVFVMGPSGSGKSTLLRLLAFLEPPDQGRVHLTLRGDEYFSNHEKKPWPRVTCVFQKQFLWPHLTLRQNILLPLQAQGRADINERLEKSISLFGMHTFIDRYPNEVSGGQAQRAALARALALDPQIILIDEPHTALDLEQQEILNSHLMALRRSGVGLILVSHSLDLARRFADLVIVLENGLLTDFGTRSVFDRPTGKYLRAAHLIEDAIPSSRTLAST